jgi:hypothetical protein
VPDQRPPARLLHDAALHASSVVANNAMNRERQLAGVNSYQRELRSRGDTMGFSYRKSMRMGPFRMAASKSGISFSLAGKGARVTKRANGKVQTTLSVPGTGLRCATPGSKQAKKGTGKPGRHAE